MGIDDLVFVLFGLSMLGYFVLRGLKLARVSGFRFYLPAEIIQYTLPALLILAQSSVVELSGIDNSWKGFLAVGLVIVAGALGIIGHEQRRRWEQNAQEMFPDRWSRWLANSREAGLVAPVDRLFRYISTDS